MRIGAYERVTLEGGELKQTRLILDRAPPWRGELTDLGASLWHACDVAALAIDDAGKPVPGNVLGTEKAQKLSVLYDNGEPAKGQAVLEDGNLDIGNQILREGTSYEVGYYYRSRGECAVLSRDRERIAAWQDLPPRGERVQELLAICIRD